MNWDQELTLHHRLANGDFELTINESHQALCVPVKYTHIPEIRYSPIRSDPDPKSINLKFFEVAKIKQRFTL